MVWVIAFEDGKETYFWRTELYDDNDEFIDYEDVKTFETKEQAEKFMYAETDSRAFDFYVKEVSQDEIDKYEKEVGVL